jgi:hypothetical protein
MEVLWIIIWLVFSGACAAVARERGRSGLNWFLIALLLTGPVITLVILCSIDRKNVAAWDRPRTDEEDHYARYGARFQRQHHTY